VGNLKLSQYGGFQPFLGSNYFYCSSNSDIEIGFRIKVRLRAL